MNLIWLGGDIRPIEQECIDNTIKMHHDWRCVVHHDLSAFDAHPDAKLLHRWAERVRTINRPPVKTLAYLADMLRLVVLWNEGGVYLDADIWMIRRMDETLDHEIWFSSIPEAGKGEIGKGVFVSEAAIGSVAKHPTINSLIERFMGQCDRVMTPGLGRAARHNKHFIYPPAAFVPHRRWNDRGNLYRHTRETFGIHCWREYEYDIGKLRDIRDAAMDERQPRSHDLHSIDRREGRIAREVAGASG